MRVAHFLLLGSLVLPACGGDKKPAEDAASESASSDKKSEDSSDASAADKGDGDSDDKDSGKKEDADSSDAKDAKKDDKKKKEEASSDTSGPAVKRTPKDRLTAPDVIFMFSFNASDMKAKAEERCDKSAKSDPKKRADCMTKEKKKIDVDGMRFKQERGRWYWMQVRRKGKTLVNLHKLPIEFGKETDDSIVLKPVGKDEGTQRGKAPGETKVEVPNDYEIVIQDPEQGKMVFEAKIGLEGEQQR